LSRFSKQQGENKASFVNNINGITNSELFTYLAKYDNRYEITESDFKMARREESSSMIPEGKLSTPGDDESCSPTRFGWLSGAIRYKYIGETGLVGPKDEEFEKSAFNQFTGHGKHFHTIQNIEAKVEGPKKVTNITEVS